MKFRALAAPPKSVGQSFKGVKHIVLPNQAMTLQQILDRFTRGQPLPIGQSTFGTEEENRSFGIDLEKLAFMDLAEKDEYKKQLDAVVARYNEIQTNEKKRKSVETQEALKAQEEARIQKLVEDRVAELRSAKLA